MVEFAGWEMPVWYAGIQAEHAAVRTAVGLFDVSHMGEFIVRGRDARAVLRRALTNDVAELEIGEAQYTVLPNADGGTVDDLLAYRLPDDPRGHPLYLLVVNASNIDKDREWLRAQVRAGEDAVLDDRSGDMALVALQGPRAPAVLSAVTKLGVWQMGYYHFDRGDVAGVPALVSRTGYTGEDGWEILLPAASGARFFDALIAAGVKPCGLGARDTLRLEAGMNLYGQDMDESTSPLVSGLAWTVAWEPAPRAFIGREALERERAAGVRQQLAGLVLEVPGVMRHDQRVSTDAGTGIITSGGFSPTMNRSIALARVPVGASGEVQVDIRGVLRPARLVRPPFVRRGRVLVA